MTGNLADSEFVEAWFRERIEQLLPDEPHTPTEVRVRDVNRMSRGVSRQTWTVDVEMDGRSVRRFAVRRDHEAGSIIASSLVDEFGVYRRLEGTGVPVARVLWFEDDPEWMPNGRPAYVRELVDGDWRLPALDDHSPEGDAERIRLSKEHLDKLALVHGVDWLRQGFDTILRVPDSPAHCALNLMDQCSDQIARYGVEPSPVLAEAMASLRARAPQTCDRVVLCKGTNGLGEEVWRNGRIVAMSDWEMAALADPAYDFAQCQEMIPEIVRDGRRVWGLPEALAYYAERTGTEIGVDRVAYYREFYGLLQFTYTQHVACTVRAMERAPLRFVWTATEVAFRSELRMAKHFAGNLMKEGLA
ncbi:phosphotransferase family protein [Rhodococcus sp. CX]|uniref:phosphotransferase family protein n=1 Tax=Rhodococcus sp. CX TaxID=2789880 RepID=UPI0018CE9D16|nr:phosphotransferase family protein [Rhodococcus sp. CX]MBH0119522.1 phosphotransferase family protein [Rhodococcus sp. CX]